jgi:hypothetical protein
MILIYSIGVRVRPLTARELGEGGKEVLAAQNPEVRLGEKRFTYDAVFDANVDQNELYAQVSTPLLKSFVEGFNATVSMGSYHCTLSRHIVT